jgi:hypothetical protein
MSVGTLCATISAAGICTVGDVPVSVSGSALPAVSFHVVAHVTRGHVPLVRR